MKKMDGKTMDIVAENVGKLKELFPEAFTEDGSADYADGRRKIDFEVLKELLGEYVSEKDERYSFTWNGKSKARMIAQTPSTGTLRPCKEESVDWDSTQNIFIEGDNLEVLKLLQKSYHKKVKMIYIDPPYNTGNDFVYKDDFRDNIKNYKEITGQVDGEGRNLSSNPETSGRYHTDWLNMMYPRLKLARNLLKDDGVIVIHIDENEYPNLEKMLSEIFGEENNLGTIVWDKRNPKGEVAGVAQQHELLSIYSRSKKSFKELCKLKRPKENAQQILSKAQSLVTRAGKIDDVVREEFRKWLSNKNFSKGEKAYSLMDDEGIVFQSVSMAAPDKPETRSHRPLLHPKTGKPCPVPAKGWRFPDETMDQLVKNNEVVFGNDERSQPRRKYLLTENLYENVSSLLYFGGSDDALGLPFDNPKPVLVAKKLLESVCKADDTIFDFFAGSGTTAHAVYKLNEENKSSLKYILIQLPEICGEKSEAFKAGYKTISDIAKERIRRAAAKIKEELSADDNPQITQMGADLFNSEDNNLRKSVKSADKLDLGFKVFKLDSTNIKPWEADFDSLNEEFLGKQIENIKRDRREEDVLYEILLKYGLDLTLPIMEHAIAGHKVFDIGMGALIICLSDDISLEVVEGIAKLKDEFKPEIMRVVFKDSGFKDDVVKTNAVQILKQAGIVDVRSL